MQKPGKWSMEEQAARSQRAKEQAETDQAQAAVSRMEKIARLKSLRLDAKRESEANNG